MPRPLISPGYLRGEQAGAGAAGEVFGHASPAGALPRHPAPAQTKQAPRPRQTA